MQTLDILRILQIRAGREALEASGMCGYGTSVQRKSFGTTVFLWHLPFQDARGQPGLMNTRKCSKERQGPTHHQAPGLGEDLSDLGKNKPEEPYRDPTHPPHITHYNAGFWENALKMMSWVPLLEQPEGRTVFVLPGL